MPSVAHGFACALGLVALASAPACTKKSPPASVGEPGDATTPIAAASTPAIPPGPTMALEGTPGPGTSGPFALVSWAGKSVLVLADADTRSVFLFDATTLERIGKLAVPGAPSAIVLAGGALYVALADRDEVLELRAHATEKGTLVPGRTLRTSREPVALAAIEKDLLVVTGLGHVLERFSLAALSAAKPKAVLGREPRGLLVLSNGDVVVGHASEGPLTFVRAAGTIETADLTEPSVCTSAAADECMTLSDLRATQHFALGLHEGKVLVAGSLSASKGSGSEGGSYGGGGSFNDVLSPNVDGRPSPPRPPQKFPVVSLAVDVVSPEARKVETLAGRRRTGSCALPRALLVDAAHKEVVIACLGSEKLRDTRSARCAAPMGPRSS